MYFQHQQEGVSEAVLASGHDESAVLAVESASLDETISSADFDLQNEVMSYFLFILNHLKANTYSHELRLLTARIGDQTVMSTPTLQMSLLYSVQHLQSFPLLLYRQLLVKV